MEEKKNAKKITLESTSATEIGAWNFSSAFTARDVTACFVSSDKTHHEEKSLHL